MSTNNFWKQIIKKNMKTIKDKCSELYFKAWEDAGKDFYVTIDKNGEVDSYACNHGLTKHSSSWYAGEIIELACFSFYQVDIVIQDENIVSMLKKMNKGDILEELEYDNISDKLGYLAELGEHDVIHALDMEYITEKQEYYIDLALKNVFDFFEE